MWCCAKHINQHEYSTNIDGGKQRTHGKHTCCSSCSLTECTGDTPN